MERKKIDAAAAEMTVRRNLEGQYGTRLKSTTFTKVWYSSAGIREFWDVEGVEIIKRGILTKERRSFRYQVDPDTGEIIGYQEIVTK